MTVQIRRRWWLGMAWTVVVALPLAVASGAAPASRFTLAVPDLAHGVADTYTASAFGCSGGNQSPQLKWSGAPAGTKSFVVTLFDRDEHSTPSGWWHWVVFDVPASVNELPVGAGAENSKLLAPGTRQGRIDLGNMAYHGPCPDKGDAPHRYVFTVYAVDVAKLPVADGSSGAMVVSTVRDHLLGKAVVVVQHGR